MSALKINVAFSLSLTTMCSFLKPHLILFLVTVKGSFNWQGHEGSNSDNVEF